MTIEIYLVIITTFLLMDSIISIFESNSNRKFKRRCENKMESLAQSWSEMAIQIYSLDDEIEFLNGRIDTLRDRIDDKENNLGKYSFTFRKGNK